MHNTLTKLLFPYYQIVQYICTYIFKINLDSEYQIPVISFGIFVVVITFVKRNITLKLVIGFKKEKKKARNGEIEKTFLRRMVDGLLKLNPKINLDLLL